MICRNNFGGRPPFGVAGSLTKRDKGNNVLRIDIGVNLTVDRLAILPAIQGIKRGDIT